VVLVSRPASGVLGKRRCTKGASARANVELGQKVGTALPENCEAPRWRFLDKRRAELTHRVARAGGIKFDGVRALPWDGALLIREVCRRNKRGCPALKRDFYDLAGAYALSARTASRQIRYGFFPALAVYFSMP
jgi:hypothetical protein